jgi:iron complex outermembrane recepter protein
MGNRLELLEPAPGLPAGSLRRLVGGAAAAALAAIGPMSAQADELTAQAPAGAPTQSAAAAAPAAGAAASVAADDLPPPPPPPAAAAGEAGIKTINIVGRHRSEDQQDAPIAISAVSGEQLDQQHIQQLVELNRVVPNFTNVNSNPRVSANTIRGIGGNAANDGSESGVGFIVDNVFFTNVGFNFFDLTDLDHIEVLRGPQGTLLGKNTTIGAVVVTTNQPTFQPEAGAEFTTGSRDAADFNGFVSGPLIGDQLAARLTVYDDYQQGYIRNHFNNVDYGDTKREGGQLQFLFKPDANFIDRLITRYFYSDEYNNYISTLSVNSQFAANLLAKVPRGFKFDLIADPTDFNEADANRLKTEIQGVSNEANWQLGDLTLTSISAYEDFRFDPLNDGADIPLFTDGFEVHDNVNQFTQEFRAAETIDDVDYQGGFFALRELVGAHQRQIYGQDAAEFALGSIANPNPVVNPALLNGVEADHFGEANTTSLAPYIHAIFHIDDKFDLAAGFRDTFEYKFDSDQASLKGTQNSPNLAETVFLTQGVLTSLPGIQNTGSGLEAVKNANGTFSLVPFTPNGPIAGSEQANSTAFIVNPSYKFTPDFLGYASIAQGEKSGAAVTNAVENINAVRSVTPLFTLPERSTDFELGFKSDQFDHHLRLDLNLYYDIIDNFQTQVTDVLGVVNGIRVTSSFLSNAPGVLLRGVEFDGSYIPFDDLTFSVASSFNDARFTSFANSPNPFFNIPGARTAANPTASETGAQVPNAPRVSADFNISYERPISANLVGFAFVNEDYRSRVYFGTTFLPTDYQSDFALTDLGLGVRTADGRYSAQFFVKNAFNTHFAVSISSSAAATGSTTQTLGEPLFIGATLTAKFD